MKFVLNQTFHPTFSGSSNQVFMLDAFECSFIKHLVFNHCVECKTYALECVSNVFTDIRMSIICGVPQKIKRREGHRQDEREVILWKKLDQKLESIWLKICHIHSEHFSKSSQIFYSWLYYDLLKYSLSLLRFSHFLVFPLWGFSSSEFTNSCNTKSVAMSAILNYWMNELLNLRILNETCWMKLCEWEYWVSSNIRSSVQNFILHEY